MSDERIGREGKDGTIFAKCGHTILKNNAKKGQKLELGTLFDWCPECSREIVERFNELQNTFDYSFGGSE